MACLYAGGYVHVTGSDTPCVSTAMPGDAGAVGARWILGVALLRSSHAGHGSTVNPGQDSIRPQLLQLVRSARNVIPNCAAVRVFLHWFSSSAF